MVEMPEMNHVIRFCFYQLSSKKLTKCLNYKLKLLSSSLLIVLLKIKDS